MTEIAVASTIAILLFSGMISLTRISRDGHEMVVDRSSANEAMRASTEDISLDLRMTNVDMLTIDTLENGSSMLTFQKALGTTDGTAVYGAQTESYGTVVPSDDAMALAPASAIRTIDAEAVKSSDTLESDRIAAEELLSDASSDAEKRTALSAMSDAMYKEDWYTCYLAVPDPSNGGKTSILIRQLLNGSFEIMRTEKIAGDLVATGGFVATQSGDTIIVVIQRVNSDGTITVRKFAAVPKN